jgi:hypothetical protein
MERANNGTSEEWEEQRMERAKNERRMSEVWKKYRKENGKREIRGSTRIS